MARKLKEDAEKESRPEAPQIISDHTEEIGNETVPLVNDAPTVVGREPPPKRKAEKAPEVKVSRYRVEMNCRIMGPAGITVLKAGKVIDEVQYDIKHLQSQGARLTQL